MKKYKIICLIINQELNGELIIKEQFETVIVGAGIIGLAIARKLSKKKKVLVIEKNKRFGEENSSRNSGVLHAGIYYKKGSLKSRLCQIGNRQIYKYAKKRNINCIKLGKLIISCNESEDKILKKININARNNNVILKVLSKKEVEKIEPEIVCKNALYSKNTGLIDVYDLMQNFVADIENNNGVICYQTEVTQVEPNNVNINFCVNNKLQKFSTKVLINCAGLQSHTLAMRIVGFPKSKIPKIRFVKGNYMKLSGKNPFKKLIYPIPSKDGLGIHTQINFSKELIFGPDTEEIKDINFDVNDNIEKKFKKSISKYWPEILNKKILPDYAGIRTKLTNNDFLIQGKNEHKIKGVINLFGIESPGLTSSLAIADLIDKILSK